MSSQPRISIVTPSYNQGKFLEKTILSVLEQDYPNLEYIIIDGGSTDESVEIIKKYADRLTYWVSEPDRGQSHALNKGFALATGEIIAWINSDDYYEPEVFEKISACFLSNPEINILMGDCNLVNEEGDVFEKVINYERGIRELKRYWVEYSIPTQPAIFFRRGLLEKFGFLDETLHYSMDFDLWLRFARENTLFHVDLILANYRFHPQAKGGDQDWSKFLPECKKVYNKYPDDNITTEIMSVERNLFEQNHKLEKRILNLDNTLQILLDRADKQLTARQYEIDALKQQNSEMQNYIEALHNSIETLHNSIEALHNSFSWRLTAPLRRMLTVALSLMPSNRK